MEQYIKKLRQHIGENMLSFGEVSDVPCLDALWWHYAEHHSMSSATTK